MEKVIDNSRRFLKENGLSLKDLTWFMGFIESLRPVIEIAPLHYRALQKRKLEADRAKLEESVFLTLNGKMKDELKWWSKDVRLFSSSPMRPRKATAHFQTDASKALGAGWGGFRMNGDSAQGLWTEKERSSHINVLELKAVHNTLDELLKPREVALVDSDSRSAVSYIRKMGGTRSEQLCKEAMKLWNLVLARNAWVIPNWVPGKENEKADLLSRSSMQTWDFSLRTEIFEAISKRWFLPEIDLFASQECHKIPRFVSWKPCEGVTTDALNMTSWPNKCYMFPPVPLLLKTVARLMEEEVEGIVIAPNWPNALWYTMLMEMTVEGPLLLGKAKQILWDPRTESPPAVKLDPLAAFRVRGGACRARAFP